MSWTLGAYVARRFLSTAALCFLGVLALVVMVDLVERLNQNSDGVASFSQLVGMALLHAPSIALVAAPFTVLLATMACFARLARASEIVVARAAGVSLGALLAPAVAVAVVLGALMATVYNPVASAFVERFEALEERYFGRSSSSLALSGGGIWLRQVDEARQTVIRADRAASDLSRLWAVTAFRFDANDRLEARIEARTAVLEDGAWRLNAVSHWRFGPGAAEAGERSSETRATAREVVRLPTDLTPERIAESFAAPRTIGFWRLPDFIALLEAQGFSAERHRVHFQGLLAYPLVFAAMTLIGAAFSMRPARFSGLGIMALGCVMTGFGYFFLSDLAAALGASGAVPPLVAAWAPPASALLFALGLLLHVEDV
ncbi:MAG: LPS export ABC transporter permease LptG [Paracoccaceae bacterium]